jgi:ribose 1,5-bisphosphokinase
MTQRLIYVVGPSGAGKDSVLMRLRETWDTADDACWARRTVTREVQPGGEANESVSESDFKRLLDQQAFALHWQANGLFYGIRQSELSPLYKGQYVFVNGSRGHLDSLLAAFPKASVVHITASLEVLRERLKLRQRECEQDIDRRLARNVNMALPKNTLLIQNDGSLDAAVQTLRLGLKARLFANGQRLPAARAVRLDAQPPDV